MRRCGPKHRPRRGGAGARCSRRSNAGATGGGGRPWTASCPTTPCGSMPKGGAPSPRPSPRGSRAAGSRASLSFPPPPGPRPPPAATPWVKEIEILIRRFPHYSEEGEQFSAALYGTSEVLKIDGEGRAILTEPLKSHAGIKDEITCAGLGHKFQIWEPGRFRAELAEATEKVRALKRQLGSRVAAEGPHGARE